MQPNIIMTAPNPGYNPNPNFSQLTALFPDEIRMMMATLRMSKLGGLSVAECENLELQAKLFEYFRQRLEDERIYLYQFEVDEKHINLVQSLTELTDQAKFKDLELKNYYQSIVIFVHGLEKLSDAHRERFLQLLNFLRDQFTMIAQPVVIWAKPALVTKIARQATDFWNWKGTLFSFPSDFYEVAATKEIHAGKQPPLQRYVSALLRDPDYAIWSDLYLPLKAVRTLEPNYVSAERRHKFTDEELARLSALFPDITEFPAHETIFNLGDKGDALYILLSGEVEIIIPDETGNGRTRLRQKRGDFFGEIALIRNISRTATVRTLEKCQCIVLTKPQLRQVAKKIGDLLALLRDTGEWRFESLVRTTPEDPASMHRFDRQRSVDRPTPVEVFELIKDDNKTVILGEAGTGKTTVLQSITLKYAQAAQRSLVANKTPEPLPIFLKLNALTPRKSIEDLILEVLQSYGLVEFQDEQDIKQLLQGKMENIFPARQLIIIMDGLNEIQDSARHRRHLDRFVESYPNHRFILSCRAQDYIPIKGFRTALLQNLTQRDIETFLVNYVGPERGKKMAWEIYSDRQLTDLAQTPLALYMFTQITKKGTERLPKNRGVLFERFTDNLLERIDSEWWKIFGRSRSKTPLSFRKALLAELGLAMQQAQSHTFSKREWFNIIAAQMEAYRTTASPAEFEAIKFSPIEDIHEEIKFSGLIRYSPNPDQMQIEFAHHTYQEFYAALALRNIAAPIEDLINKPERLRQWHNTVVLLYGISPNKVELFPQILGDSNNYARIWLGAQCLANTGEEIAVITESFNQNLVPEQRFAMLFAVGLTSYQLGRYPEALTYLLRAAALQPGSAEVQYELGSLYRLLNQYKKAIHHLEQAINLQPDFVDAYNQLGITYYDQQKYEEALTIFIATTQLEPTNAHHYYNLGTIQKVLQDYDAAKSSFEIALQLKSDYVEARNQLNTLEKALSSRVVQALKTIPMLSKLTLEQSIILAERLKVADYKAGSIVFHMGELGDTFYIIESGKVQVLAPDMPDENAPAKSIINNLKAGDFFGEIALLRAVPRTATIRCASNVRLLELSREDFNATIQQYPSIAQNMAQTSSHRLLHDRKSGRGLELQDYYDPGYLKTLLQKQDEVTLIMADIHGSTFLTNGIGPELMLEFLDEYLLRMSKIIVSAGGAMDKSLGDSVMGVFGKFPDRPGESATSPAMRALFASLQMRQAYLNLREEWKSRSSMFMQTGMGIGLSTGPVSMGTIGPEGVMVGAAVNISSKLSKMAVQGRDESEIYIDQRTYNILGDTVDVELLDQKYVTSKSGGVKLNAFRVVRSNTPIPPSDPTLP